MHSPRVLITRSPHQASELADALRSLGADPILIPTIETVEPTTYAPLDAALARLDTFHWLLFTSANAVQAFHTRLSTPNSVILSEARSAQPKDLPPGRPQPLRSDFSTTETPTAAPRIAAIGQATARALTAIGLTPDLIPPQAVAESLAEALLPLALQPDGSPTRFLLVRAEQAREHLPETLRAAGGEVTVAPAYRTLTPAGSLEALRALLTTNPPDAVTFTSSSTARNLFELLATAHLILPPEVIRASIGPITTQALTELGHPPHVEAAEATVQNLAATLMLYLNLRKST